MFLGKDVFAMLPTGFGKSDIFMIFPKLVQKSILVISPLKALVADQIKKYEGRVTAVYIDDIFDGDLSSSKLCNTLQVTLTFCFITKKTNNNRNFKSVIYFIF